MPIDDAIAGAYTLLEELEGEAVTYTEVDAGSSNAVSLTMLWEDQQDTGIEIVRRGKVPTASLSRNPLRGDTIEEADGTVWTVRESGRPVGFRAEVECRLLQTRG